MSLLSPVRYPSTWAIGYAAIALSAMAIGAPGSKPCAAADKAIPAIGSEKPAVDAVEMFEAIEQKLIEVQLIPRDSTEATLVVKNQADKPLRVRMPEAFAGVPVLAQIGGGINGGGGGGSTNQGIGGGMGMGMGMGGGFFNVGPDTVRRVKVPTVCLEHGKDDPNPRVPYKIVPLSDFTQDARIHQLCVMLGNRKIDQSTAQAAAWHLADGLSWQALAQKVKVKHLNGSVEMYFHPRQVSLAAQAVAVISAKVDSETSSASSDTSTSLGEIPLDDEPVKLSR